MRGSVAMETLLISVVAIILLIFAGKAIQAYGVKFAEDVDRMAWIRQSVYKIYASVRMLETCGVGSVDTVDVYVPHNGKIEISGKVIKGTVTGLNREYPALKGSDEYKYSISTNSYFINISTGATLPPGWARIRLKKIAENVIETSTIISGLRSWKDVE